MKQLPDHLKAATLLFPELSLITEGSFWDKYGIDGYIGKASVQCKHDKRIAVSGNIWHEIYEKSALNDKQAWRKSPGIAELYIFTTEDTLTYTGYLISVDILAQLESGKVLKTIYPNNGAATSMGFLIKIDEFNGQFYTRQKGKRGDGYKRQD